MGLFGNNEMQIKIESAKKVAHIHADFLNEIGDLVSKIEENNKSNIDVSKINFDLVLELYQKQTKRLEKSISEYKNIKGV